MEAGTQAEVMASEELADFLGRAGPLAEEVLQMNEARGGGEGGLMRAMLHGCGGRMADPSLPLLCVFQVLDIFEDELASLANDAVVGSKALGKASGSQQSHEDRTFNANRYTSGKVISCLQWHPVKKGIVAVACVRPDAFEQRVQVRGRMDTPGRGLAWHSRVATPCHLATPAVTPPLPPHVVTPLRHHSSSHRHPTCSPSPQTAGTPDTHHVLLWSLRDTMGNPELVLEAPSEIVSFAFNPANPDLVAGGCYNGQVVLWDISAHSAALDGRRRAQGPGEAREETPHVPHVLISEVEASHSKCVTDVQWLPGVEVARRGEVAGLGEGGAPGRDCFVLASTALDGNIVFWDTRPEKYQARRWIGGGVCGGCTCNDCACGERTRRGPTPTSFAQSHLHRTPSHSIMT